MVSRAHTWANTSQHHYLYILRGQERVAQNHGQFTLTEWHVLTLGSLASLLIKSSDALLEAKQRLVDISSFGLSLLIVALTVLGSLTSS